MERRSLAEDRILSAWLIWGISPHHASTVPLVLNPATIAISAQFNVVSDDWFSTFVASTDQLPDFNSPEWSNIFGSSN